MKVGLLTLDVAKRVAQEKPARAQRVRRIPKPRQFEDSPRAPLVFKNASGGTAPAYAVMRVTDVVTANGKEVLEITQPTSADGIFVFNGSQSVSNGDLGVCFAGPIVDAVHDSADSPTNGDAYGVDGWELQSDGDAVLSATILGVVDASNDIVRVHVRPPGAMSGMIPLDVVAATSPGSQGTSTTKATWAYDFTESISGDSFRTGLDPTTGVHKWVRHVGQIEQADFGMGYNDATDGNVVVWVNEVIITEVCT